jgi:hypothetical protein
VTAELQAEESKYSRWQEQLPTRGDSYIETHLTTQDSERGLCTHLSDRNGEAQGIPWVNQAP